jgi:hypothetical protein
MFDLAAIKCSGESIIFGRSLPDIRTLRYTESKFSIALFSGEWWNLSAETAKRTIDVSQILRLHFAADGLSLCCILQQIAMALN